MATNYSAKKLVEFFFETGSLKKIIRSHQQEFFTSDPSDNISSHSFRVAIIAFFLAILENADLQKTVAMALFHDLPETRSGDQNWVHKKYVKVFEEEIIKDQFKNLPKEKYLNQLLEEYKKRKTKEAKIAKDADLIEQLLLLKEYELKGNKEAKKWLKTKRDIKTRSAKLLASKIIKSDPGDWTKQLSTPKRR